VHRKEQNVAALSVRFCALKMGSNATFRHEKSRYVIKSVCSRAHLSTLSRMSIPEGTQVQSCGPEGRTHVRHTFRRYIPILGSDHFVPQASQTLDLGFKYIAALKHGRRCRKRRRRTAFIQQSTNGPRSITNNIPVGIPVDCACIPRQLVYR
jgi:hypothetical protein